MLDLAQFYRDFFQARVTVNDWAWNEDGFTLRGYRPPRTDTGAELSQHKFGRAFDCDIEGYSADEVRSIIQANEGIFMSEGLTTIESGEIATTWIHSDIRQTEYDRILVVTP